MMQTTDSSLHFSERLYHIKLAFIIPLLPHRQPFVIFILALLANLLILSPVALMVKSIAVLVLTGLLPGALVVACLVTNSNAPPPRWEQGLYTIGAGYATMTIPMLALSYLPGGITREAALLSFDGLVLLLLALHQWLMANQIPAEKDNPGTAPSKRPQPLPLVKRRWLLAGVLALAMTGGFLRFTNLGYAEFQGDEARVTLYSANVIQGYENALFVHRKGPAEILIPTVLYTLTERLTETTARLPFAIANFTALFVIFALGWRLFGPITGWAAGMLLAVDGYMVAFARIVQYQSIVFLMVVLVVLVVYRLVHQPKAMLRYFMLAALLLATGLLAHYEALLVALPVGYLLWQIWRRGASFRQLVQALWLPILIGGLVLASFYVPFVLKPTFKDTYHYLVEQRMGAGGVYNNFVDFFNRTTVYSSTYYLLTLIGLAISALLLHFARNLSGGWRWLVAALVLTGMALTFWSPTWLTLGRHDYTWLFFFVLFGVAWLLPNFPLEERLVWLWFGAPFLLNLFFTAVPNTHVYGFLIGWALLAGFVIERGWQTLRTHWPLHTAQMVAVPLALSAIFVFGFYEYWFFVYHDVEVLRTWPSNRPKGYWVTYDKPTTVAIFGFPLNTGWKVVGDLFANGTLHGNYATNVTDTVATWYTRGVHSCDRAAAYYILANRVEPERAEDTNRLRKQLQSDHRLLGTVLVQGQPGLEIYQAGKGGNTPQQFLAEPYAKHFDQVLAGPDLVQNGPVGRAQIQRPLNLQLGNALLLKGYNLDKTTAKSGDSLTLNLYWQATQPLDTNYSVFVQLIDLKNFQRAGQQDGQPACDTYPTDNWLPGDLIADHYSIPIDPEARPGEYSLITGMYLDDVRLPVYTSSGQEQGNQIELTKVQVDS